jgi:hypothetical protein
MDYKVRSLDMQKFASDLDRTPAAMARAQRQFYIASARTVAGLAQGLAYSQGGVMAKSASDIRSVNPSTVVYGGKGYSMGAEFGSYRYKQFQTWRGNTDGAGYFLWPAVRMFRDKDFMNKWSNEVWDVIRPTLVR